MLATEPCAQDSALANQAHRPEMYSLAASQARNEDEAIAAIRIA
jgi:hypothetical protein